MATRRAVLRDGAAVLGVGVVPGGVLKSEQPPDAALLALCAELSRRHVEYQRLWSLTPDDGPETDADRAFKTYGETVWPRCADLIARLADLPATTAIGMRAKAAAALAIAENDHHDGSDNELDLVRAVLRGAAQVGA